MANQHPNEKLFVDIVSGAIPFKEREKAKVLLDEVEKGSVSYVSISSIDRLGRNLSDILLATLEAFDRNNIILKVDNLAIESRAKDKPNSAFKLIISVMAIAEMEKETLLERQREGIAIAKGVYKGRVRGSKESTEEFLAKHKNVIKYLKQGQSLRNTAKLADVSLGTVQKVKKLI